MEEQTVDSLSEQLTKIKINMERDFVSFGLKEQQAFLYDLAVFLGCTEEDFKDVTFRSGCVIFEGKLPKALAAKLIEIFETKDQSDITAEEINDLKELLAKHGITRITDDLEIRVNIAKNRHLGGQSIILIHGWNGRDDSFGKMPELLKNKFDCEVGIYHYPTGLLKDSPSIVYISRNLENWLRNYYPNKELAIIAHSMGGIVTRKFIVNQIWKKDIQLDQNIRLITFIASPHHGSVISQFPAALPLTKSAQLTELSPNSPFLVDLDEQWLAWSKDRRSMNCLIRTIYGPNDQVVSTNNALGDDPNAVPILGVDHINIIKPNNANDEVIVTLSRFLQEAHFKQLDGTTLTA
jgi:hypothetical protein